VNGEFGFHSSATTYIEGETKCYRCKQTTVTQQLYTLLLLHAYNGWHFSGTLPSGHPVNTAPGYSTYGHFIVVKKSSVSHFAIQLEPFILPTGFCSVHVLGISKHNPHLSCKLLGTLSSLDSNTHSGELIYSDYFPLIK